MSSALVRALLVGFVFLAAPAVVRAQQAPQEVTVETTDGRTVRGRLVDFGTRSYRVELADGNVVEIPEAEVVSVTFRGEARARESAQGQDRPVYAGKPVTRLRLAAVTRKGGGWRVIEDPAAVRELLDLLGDEHAIVPSGGEDAYTMTVVFEDGSEREIHMFDYGEWDYGGRLGGFSSKLVERVEALLR